jgi:hypothetical protein
MTEDELVSDRIRDQTREFQRPRSNKTYLVRSAIEDAREEDKVDCWRKLAQGAVLMLKRIEKDTRIDELTCVRMVLRKPGGYPEFPVFPWPGGPGYKRLIPSVERRKGFQPKWHDVEEDTGYTPKRAAVVHRMIAPAGYQFELDLLGELLLLPQRIAPKFSCWDNNDGSSSELLESNEEAHKEEVWRSAEWFEEDPRPESAMDLENRPRWPQEQQATLSPPLLPTLGQAVASSGHAHWNELAERLVGESNHSDGMPGLEPITSGTGDLPQYNEEDPRCCPGGQGGNLMDEEDVPQDMELDQPALVLSKEASDDNDLPRLVRSDKIRQNQTTNNNKVPRLTQGCQPRSGSPVPNERRATARPNRLTEFNMRITTTTKQRMMMTKTDTSIRPDRCVDWRKPVTRCTRCSGRVIRPDKDSTTLSSS